MTASNSTPPTPSTSLLTLTICATSIYASFISWGLLQERLTTRQYDLPISLRHPTVSSRHEFFKSPVFLGSVQALFSTAVAAAYIAARQLQAGQAGKGNSFWQASGLAALTPRGAARVSKTPASQTISDRGAVRSIVSPLAIRYVLISSFQSLASSLGLLSLSHGISFLTLILGKSCKLVPVLFMNVLLYRRKFALHKYLVVALVTTGITMFTLFGEETKKKAAKTGGGGSLVGIALLMANLLLDGATNSTQDDVFSNYSISGPQMMLVMNLFSTILLSTSLVVHIPAIPLLNPEPSDATELSTALAFIRRHPEVLRDVVAYASAGALGQVAIFETLERFGSLTLVSITVTRKLFTMLLSVFVYSHRLVAAQWLGVSIVFAGIGVEAYENRRKTLAAAKGKAGAVGGKDAVLASGLGKQVVEERIKKNR